MPLFGGQKKAGNHGSKTKSASAATATSSGAHNGAVKPNNEHRHVGSNKKATNGTSTTPTLPPPIQPQENRHWTQLPPPPPPSKAVIPSRQELVFHTQLAHGSATKDVKDFSNVKELYAKIAVVFDIPTTDIVFCTLNTHKADMTRLLGGQIGLEDFIFAHIRGKTKEVKVMKSEAALGLTITDNSAGYAFVKRIKDNSILSRVPEVCVGDLIEAVNGQSMIGSRHFEVAKLLKELPRQKELTLRLTETRKAFDAIAPRSSSSKGGAMPVLEGDSSRLEGAVSKGEGRATLRLKKDGQAVVEEVRDWETKAAESVDDILENFLGIRDLELAQTMVDLARDKRSLDEFAVSMHSHLGEFEFPDEFVEDVWTSFQTAKTVAASKAPPAAADRS